MAGSQGYSWRVALTWFLVQFVAEAKDLQAKKGELPEFQEARKAYRIAIREARTPQGRGSQETAFVALLQGIRALRPLGFPLTLENEEKASFFGQMGREMMFHPAGCGPVLRPLSFPFATTPEGRREQISREARTILPK